MGAVDAFSDHVYLGIDGWGSSTRQLRAAMDLVAAGRGFEPPFFVDLRISRSVRAVGFREAAFEKVVGKARYQWMPALGNERIKKRNPRIQIHEPAAAEELLGAALRRITRRQRVVMFCQCPLPGRPRGHDRCHRVEVASLLLKAAAERDVALTVCEWPGGQPVSRTLPRSPPGNLERLQRGSKSISLEIRQPAEELLGLRWGSIVRLQTGATIVRAIADPAVYRGGEWLLPVPFGIAQGKAELSELKKRTMRERHLSGLDYRRSTPKGKGR